MGEIVQAKRGSGATAPYFTAQVTRVDSRENKYDVEWTGYQEVPGDRAVSANKLRKAKADSKRGPPKKWRPRGGSEFRK